MDPDIWHLRKLREYMGNASEMGRPVNIIITSQQHCTCQKPGTSLRTFVTAYHYITTSEVINTTWRTVEKETRSWKSRSPEVAGSKWWRHNENSVWWTAKPFLLTVASLPSQMGFEVLDAFVVTPQRLGKAKERQLFRLWEIAIHQALTWVFSDTFCHLILRITNEEMDKYMIPFKHKEAKSAIILTL